MQQVMSQKSFGEVITLDQTDEGGVERYRFVESLGLKICMMFGSSGINAFFERQPWLEYEGMNEWDEEREQRFLRKYQGMAFPIACGCQPLLIPAEQYLEAHHLEAIQHLPTFLIAVWKSDGTAVYAPPSNPFFPRHFTQSHSVTGFSRGVLLPDDDW